MGARVSSLDVESEGRRSSSPLRCFSPMRSRGSSSSSSSSSISSSSISKSRSKTHAHQPPRPAYSLPSEPVRLTGPELKSCTSDFRHVLGKDRMGEVFLGHITDTKGLRMPVLVRCLAPSIFFHEYDLLATVTRVNELRHPHLLRLVAFCCTPEHQAFLYECTAVCQVSSLLTRGSSSQMGGEAALHQLPKPSPLLLSWSAAKHSCIHTMTEWPGRLRIATGAARALEQLHLEGVTFYDFRSERVLVGQDGESMLVDVLLCPCPANAQRWAYVSCDQRNVDDKFIVTGELDSTTDVYAFGIFLLELLTRRHSSSDTFKSSTLAPLQRCNDDQAFHVVAPLLDPLLSSAPTHEVQRFTLVARACVRKSRAQRPTMTAVLADLEAVPDNPMSARFVRSYSMRAR